MSPRRITLTQPLIKKEKLITMLVLLVFASAFFQNLAATILMSTGNIAPLLIVLLKEFFLLILGIISILHARSISKRTLYPLTILSLIVAHFFYSGLLLESLRQTAMIPFILFIGTLASRSFNKDLFERGLNTLFISIIILSFIEYLLSSSSEWFLRWLGFSEFLEFKGFTRWMTNSGVLASFYSWDFVEYTGSSFRRMAGLNYIDPVVLGQFFAFPAIYYFTNRKYLLTIVSLTIIVLCLSKGGILAFIIGIFFFLINSSFKGYSLIRKIIFVIFFIAVISTILSLSHVESVDRHVSGLISGIQSIASNPLGLGIGAVGNYSGLYLDSVSSVSESFAGVLMGQVGVLAFLFYAVISIFISAVKTDDPFWLSVKYSALAFTICSLISESALTYSATALVFFLLAMYKPIKNRSIK